MCGKGFHSSSSGSFSPSGIVSRPARRIGIMLIACAMTLALPGCAALAERTNEAIPPVPAMPNAIVTDTHICIPHDEAGELLLWIEQVEKVR